MSKKKTSIIKQEEGWDDYRVFQAKAKASSATTIKAKRLSSEAEDNSVTRGPAACQKRQRKQVQMKSRPSESVLITVIQKLKLHWMKLLIIV
jgi:hypothetical protein